MSLTESGVAAEAVTQHDEDTQNQLDQQTNIQPNSENQNDADQENGGLEIQKGSIVEEDPDTSVRKIQSEFIKQENALAIQTGGIDNIISKTAPTQSLDGKPLRLDRQGNPIIPRAQTLKMQALENVKDSPTKKKDKEDKKTKHKVTFIDKIEKDAELFTTHHVQSYKKYNSMNTYDPYYVEEGEGSSHCCNVF